MNRERETERDRSLKIFVVISKAEGPENSQQKLILLSRFKIEHIKFNLSNCICLCTPSKSHIPGRTHKIIAYSNIRQSYFEQQQQFNYLNIKQINYRLEFTRI